MKKISPSPVLPYATETRLYQDHGRRDSILDQREASGWKRADGLMARVGHKLSNVMGTRTRQDKLREFIEHVADAGKTGKGTVVPLDDGWDRHSRKVGAKTASLDILTDRRGRILDVRAPKADATPQDQAVRRAIEAMGRFNLVKDAHAVTLGTIRGLDFPVPDRVYRATFGTWEEVAADGIVRSPFSTVAEPSASADPDRYLAAILKHSARTGGSAGVVPSLSAQRQVAQRFLTPGHVLVQVDTTSDRAAFRTLVNILLTDADRLVKKGLILPATITQAATKLLNESENEVFYVKGDIPPNLCRLAD